MKKICSFEKKRLQRMKTGSFHNHPPFHNNNCWMNTSLIIFFLWILIFPNLYNTNDFLIYVTHKLRLDMQLFTSRNSRNSKRNYNLNVEIVTVGSIIDKFTSILNFNKYHWLNFTQIFAAIKTKQTVHS